MKIKVIYATQMGTTRYVANVLVKQLSEAGHEVSAHCVSSDGFEPDISGVDLLVFGAPTYDSGMLEPTMEVFTTMAKYDLSQYMCAVFGLGDSSYIHFATAVEALEKWVSERSGKTCIPSLRIDGYPHKLDQITAWTSELATVKKSA